MYTHSASLQVSHTSQISAAGLSKGHTGERLRGAGATSPDRRLLRIHRLTWLTHLAVKLQWLFSHAVQTSSATYWLWRLEQFLKFSLPHFPHLWKRDKERVVVTEVKRVAFNTMPDSTDKNNSSTEVTRVVWLEVVLANSSFMVLTTLWTQAYK